MPFDAEPSDRAAQLFCGISTADDLGLAIVTAADPDPRWASQAPDRLLAFLYVSPRPCAALDALLAS